MKGVPQRSVNALAGSECGLHSQISNPAINAAPQRASTLAIWSCAGPAFRSHVAFLSWRAHAKSGRLSIRLDFVVEKHSKPPEPA